MTPAGATSNAKVIEYQGKLVMENKGIAGSIVSPYLVTWDGVRFEPLPALTTEPITLCVWNDHLVVATLPGVSGPYPILVLEGAAWDTLGVATGNVMVLSEYQGRLVAGGQFSAVNGVSAPLVAVFDGSAWSAPGTGLSGSGVSGLAVHGGALVACGFVVPNGVASLNVLGGTWQSLGGGPGVDPNEVVSDGVYLYACGHTASAALVRWDGTTWTALTTLAGSSFADSRMTLWNGKVVVNFRPPGATVGRLAQWDGVNFSSVPGDSLGFTFGGAVVGLGTWGAKLIATGSFSSNGAVPVPCIATYDGVQWGTIAEPWTPGMTGPFARVTDMRSWGGKLIVSGPFPLIADQDHWARDYGIGAWDGSHWSPLGDGVNGEYMLLGEYAGDLVAAGYRFSVRGTSIANVARWNGTAWSALGTGAPEFTSALAEYQGDLYLASDGNVDPLTRWDGSTWSVVPGLTGGYLDTVTPAGGRLVVGGGFAQAGEISSPNVAFWDGSAWQGAGGGVNGEVYTAADWLGQPVIGGAFTGSGLTPLPGVAFWDGAQWQAMGTRVVEVDLLRVVDGELFASGDFQLPDNSVVSTIAHWTGTDWHVLGSGSNGYLFEGYGGYLYQQGYGLVHGHPSQNLSRAPLSALVDVPHTRPGATRIALSASPNPCSAFSRLTFTLPVRGHTRLTILDVAGREVGRPVDGELESGPQEVRWTAPSRPGIYFVQLEAPGGARRVARLVRLE